MNKIEQLQQAVHDADELGCVYECVDVLRSVLPDLVEAAKALDFIVNGEGTDPGFAINSEGESRARTALEKLK